MATLLAPGQVVHLATSGVMCRVGQLLGGGGQGEVYEAELEAASGATKAYALKWYYAPSATEAQRRALTEMIDLGSPHDRFLWPLDLAVSRDAAGFGYLMKLREPRFRSVLDLLQGKVKWSARTVASTGLDLADSFLRVHSKGLCYRDISFGNVFFDPRVGDVLICDNDNIGIDGRSEASVLGTPRFMAPEIVRGEAEPSTRTDLYSLSVLLFYLCFAHHPLEGAREQEHPVFDQEAMHDLFGLRPVFIFDPDDESNRPVTGAHDNALIFWAMYPQFVREVFTHAFTRGLSDPNQGRVRETVWKSTMVRLRDSIVDCLACGAENFHDRYSEAEEVRACWSCHAPTTPKYLLQMGRHSVVLNAATQLFPHHLKGRPYDFSQPLAAVSQHPRDPSVWGLRNQSADTWTTIGADGDQHEIPPGRHIRLSDGVRIEFGQVTGAVQAA